VKTSDSRKSDDLGVLRGARFHGSAVGSVAD